MQTSAHFIYKSYLISTRQDDLQPKAINEAFASDYVYWAKALPEETLVAMLTGSWCFGVYVCAEKNVKDEDRKPRYCESLTCFLDQLGSLISRSYHPSVLSLSENPSTKWNQIGLARLVTDYISLTYLTDVYILPSYQGQGISTALLSSLREILETWKDLRRLILLTNREETVRYYRKVFPGMQVQEGEAMKVMVKKYQGAGA